MMISDDLDPELDDVDAAALDRALALTLVEPDPGRVEQVRWMHAERGWREAATFCSYHQQCAHLNLKPWEFPPCWIDPDQIETILAEGPSERKRFGGAKLLRRMLAAGVSQYDPTPLDSLAAAKS